MKDNTDVIINTSHVKETITNYFNLSRNMGICPTLEKMYEFMGRYVVIRACPPDYIKLLTKEIENVNKG